MTAQWLAVAVIVPLCAVYAVWNLIGAAMRQRVAARLARMPWPAAWRRRLAKAGSSASACGCSGCDAADGAAGKPETPSIVRVHRRGR